MVKNDLISQQIILYCLNSSLVLDHTSNLNGLRHKLESGGGGARENLTPITKVFAKSSIVLQENGGPCPPAPFFGGPGLCTNTLRYRKI